mgnify:CR=1 FL=1
MADLDLVPAKRVASYKTLLRLRAAGFLSPVFVKGNLFFKKEEVNSLSARLGEASDRLLLAGGTGRRGRPSYDDLAGRGR